MISLYFQLFISITVILVSLWFYKNQTKDIDCIEGFFNEDINSCQPWLTCKDYNDITLYSLIGEGSVKLVYLAKWKTIYITVSKLKNHLYKDDFYHNLEMLKSLRSHNIAKLLGYCNETIFTKFYHLGNAYNLPISIKRHNYNLSLLSCIDLCLSYLNTIDYLHHSPIGIRVMCDSNDLPKTLTQFLIDSELNMVVNDLDALPEVNKKGIKCGSKQLFGNFVAPEQLWPYDKAFNDSEMAGYNEKIDIWKIPDVCNWFINLCSKKSAVLMKHLAPINKRCKSYDPNQRPKSSEVLNFYKKIRENINFYS